MINYLIISDNNILIGKIIKYLRTFDNKVRIKYFELIDNSFINQFINNDFVFLDYQIFEKTNNNFKLIIEQFSKKIVLLSDNDMIAKVAFEFGFIDFLQYSFVESRIQKSLLRLRKHK